MYIQKLSHALINVITVYIRNVRLSLLLISRKHNLHLLTQQLKVKMHFKSKKSIWVLIRLDKKLVLCRFNELKRPVP